MTKQHGDAGDPDVIWREWLNQILAAAAETFSVTVSGAPVHGWRDRSIGSRVMSADGPRWLRVVTEDEKWINDDWWTGNLDANAIDGVAKPWVLDVTEWQEGPRRVRAELMTLVSAPRCSPSDVLAAELDLSACWWAGLHHAGQVITAIQTQRVSLSAGHITARIRDQFGITPDLHGVSWQTAHGDLHWANLCTPFTVLDWEWWGLAPAGLDAATLYCHSLTAPATAARVRRTFAGVLSTPSGHVSQLYVIARLLSRAAHGDHPALAAPLRDLTNRLLD